MNIIDELREKYATHEFMKQKLENYIQHLPFLMKTIEEDYHKKQLLKHEINQQRDEFVEDFLNTYPFFYISQTELFIDNAYAIVSEDYIVHLIGSKLDRPLIPFKHKIIQAILKKSKENLFIRVKDEGIATSMVHLLPFQPELSTYFLTILGDIILNKHVNLIYYIDGSYKPFLKELTQTLYFILNKSLDIFKHKYYDHKYNLCRVLTGKCGLYTLPNALHIVVAAVFMSYKYENSEGFLTQSKLYNEVTILKGNTPETLIQLFLENMIKKEEGQSISYKDVYFLWQSFLRKQYLPFVISQQNLKLSLIQLGICDGDVCMNMTALTQTTLLKFKHFWEKYFIPDEDDFYELNEIADLYGKHDKSISVDTIKEVLILYPTVIENTSVLNIKCSLWNKPNDIDNAMEVFKHHVSYSTQVSEMYTFYTEYAQLHHKRVVTKDYFEKYFQ
jgi:hypothetical protein